MIAADVLGRVAELTDGTGGSVDAATGAAIGPYRKSRLGMNRSTLQFRMKKLGIARPGA